jgi:hypothetical protein
VEGLPDDDNPWEPWYDKCFGMVVVASSEEEAREIAYRIRNPSDEKGRVWKNAHYTTCKPLDMTTPGVIMLDVASA